MESRGAGAHGQAQPSGLALLLLGPLGPLPGPGLLAQGWTLRMRRCYVLQVAGSLWVADTPGPGTQSPGRAGKPHLLGQASQESGIPGPWVLLRGGAGV